MSTELRSLLERLQRDGVDAGRQQADLAVQQAQQEAGRIVAAARAEAERIVAAARAEADATEARTRSKLQQAARDLLLVVGQRIESVVRQIVAERTAQVLDGPTVLRLVTTLIEQFVARGRGASSLDVLVGEEQRHVLTEAVLSALRAKLQQGVTLHVRPGLGHGFLVRMGDGGVTHDFTAAAIAEALADLVTPQIAAIVLAAAVAPAGRS